MMMMILDGGDNEDDDETPPAKPGCQSSLPRFGKQTLCQPEITSQRLFLNLGWTSHLWADTNSSAGTSLDKRALMAGVCVGMNRPVTASMYHQFLNVELMSATHFLINYWSMRPSALTSSFVPIGRLGRKIHDI